MHVIMMDLSTAASQEGYSFGSLFSIDERLLRAMAISFGTSACKGGSIAMLSVNQSNPKFSH